MSSIIDVKKSFDDNIWLFHSKEGKCIYTQVISPSNTWCSCSGKLDGYCRHIRSIVEENDHDWSPELFCFYDTLWTEIHFEKIFQTVKGNTERCPICFDPVQEDEIYIQCARCCNNILHINCLNKWLEHKDSCPVCKSDLSGDIS